MKKSYLLLHLAVILAGFTGVFGKLISLNEGLLVWYRLLFSSIFLFLILKLLRIRYTISTQEKLRISKVGLLITLHWIFFYASIKYSNISIGVVCYCLVSFFTAIFKPLLDKEKFKISELLLSTLTLFGISLIFHFDASYQLGICLGVISSALGTLYTIYNKRLVEHFDTKIINYYQMVAGTLILGLLMPIYLFFFPSERIVPSLKDTGYLVILASFCTVGLYVIFAEVLKKIPAFTVNLTFNLEPIYAIIMAFLFFNESKQVNISFYIGLSFIITSVILQTLISIKKK
ncbi:DMT family transporter [Chryseobacterium taiwanense]|uniref:Membrane protein n=1 Tax=Chryseobacterium taiwanense TaxID=363331 RepID=A0A0B4E8D0_9FLAO|nr:DMT family transporter [Chryseobacterium taiwanense]KIC62898.1 membrane protein [Chryseobacterium taiwanense]